MQVGDVGAGKQVGDCSLGCRSLDDPVLDLAAAYVIGPEQLITVPKARWIAVGLGIAGDTRRRG